MGMRMKKISTIIIALASAAMGMAQENCFGVESQIDACGGFLTDSGCSASDYSPNENSQVTICQDGSGEIPNVNLYWAFFDLGTGDQLEIYDGPDTGSPLIGTYTTDDLQAQNITSTGSCLTLVFTSNSDSDVGSFGAEISCETPCLKPFAIVTVDESEINPMRLCVGEEVVFDGSASTFAEGVTLDSFTWDFDDGTTNTTDWPQVTHSFANPGVYKVRLFLTDNTDCSNANLTDVLVFVSTTPEITAVADDYQVCVGQEVTITGEATPVTFDPQPDVDFGGGLFIPDDQSQCFSSDLTFTAFNPGETIDEVGDLDFFFINFEHSFMGDFVITFICPDGSAIAVHQQGGGGTWLGEPVDDESLTPGVGYDYYWSPEATNGTWAENGFGGTLPAGTYESVQPFTNLLGCPLNGTWTVEVCDLWAVDNGFIFDWSIQFDPELYPELISFTPSIGLDIDSTYWSGQFFTAGGAGDVYSFVIPEEGVFDYTYTATDDFGCSYTETITVSSYPGPIPDAGADMPFCGEAQLEGVVTNPVTGIVYQYNWSPGAPLSNDNIADPVVEALAEDTWFYLTVNPSQDPQCEVTDSVWLFIPEPPASVVDTTELCAGGDAWLEYAFAEEDYTYQWTYFAPGSDEGVPAGTGPAIPVSASGDYVLLASEGECGFSEVSLYNVELLNCYVVFPNIFTPNNDGDNDNLVFEGLEYFDKSTLRVYNRWGNLMYESDNYTNNWSPTELAEGTYYYVLGIRKQDSYEFKEGWVMLVKN